MWRQIKGKVRGVTNGRSSSAPQLPSSSFSSSFSSSSSSSPGSSRRTAAAAHSATKLNDSVYELHTPWPEGEAQMEIVFFHGMRFSDYRDAYMETWMSLDGSECWPTTWLRDEIPDARILSVSYDSTVQRSSDQGRLDFRTTGESLIKDILYSARVGQAHCPLVLVGHCLGGLIIQQLCVEAEMQLHFNCQESSDQLRVLRNFLQNLKGIFYFATPQKGSRAADYLTNGLRSCSSSSNSSKLGPVMKFMQVLSSDTEQLVQDFTSCKTKYRWKTAALAETVETKVGDFKGMVVEEASARHGIDSGQFVCIRADHDTICKPEGRDSSSFQHLLMFLQRILIEAEHERETMDELHILENIPQHAVGLNSRVRTIQSKLVNAKTIGLYGMGGIGKTTLARAVYDSISSQYEYTSFIPDLRNILVRDQHRELEKRLVEHLRHYGRKVLDEDANMIWISLKGRKVLLVLDDVNSDEHLTRISQLISVDWFGIGSLVMVTSRDQKIMTDFDVIFEVTELDRQESEELLVRHVFLGQPVPHKLQRFVKKVAKHCCGVPLALEVVGSLLFKSEDEEVWKDTIRRFRSNRERNDRLHSSLMLSYDSLADVEREMFLDIAVLFQNMQIRVALVVEIWNTFWNSGHLGWQNLRRKCLVKEDREGRVWMHEELRHFGRNIACPANSSTQEWTRIGVPAKAEEVLRLPEGVGAKAQGLVIDKWRLNDQQKMQLTRTSFTRMPQLRVLVLDEVEVQSDGQIVELPKCLAYLRWANASFVQCPVDFNQLKNLTVLEILDCKNLETLQQGFELLENLRCLHLEGCAALKELPDALGKLQKLKALDLRRTGLQKLPDGLGKLKSLRTLRLNETALTRFPKAIIGLKMLRSLDMSRTGLSLLSESFGGIRNLEYLDLSRTALDALPDSIGSLQHLKFLSLEKTGIRELPDSFGGLKFLHALHCRETPLESLPESFQRLGALKILDLRQTNLRVLPDWVGELGELLELRLSETGLKSLPDTLCNLRKLQKLHLTCCQKLRTLPESIGELKSLDGLSLYGATELECYPESFGQHLSGVISLSLQYPSDGLGELAFETAKLQLSTRTNRRVNLIECGDSKKVGSDSADEREEHLEGGTQLPRLQSYLSLTRHLKTLSNLVNLNLHGGPNVRQIAVELMSVIEALPVLTRISLHEFNEIEYLPDDFGLYFHKVEVLALRGWKRLRRLPDSIMNIKVLTVLYLVGCPKFEGLPENVGDFSKLNMIYLVQCGILETLPSSFGQLHSLEYVYFEDLPNLRSLPDSFGHLRSLQLLHMHECPKLHCLPNSLAKLAHSPLSKMFIHDWCLLIDLMTLSQQDSWSAIYSHITVVYEAECSVMEKVVSTSRNLQGNEFMHALEVLELLRPDAASESSSTSGGHHLHSADVLESLTNPKFNLKVMCIGAKAVNISTDVQVAFCDQDLQPVLDLYSVIWAGCDSLLCAKNHGAILIEGEGRSDEGEEFLFTDSRSAASCEEPNVVMAESWLKRKIASIQTESD